MFTGVIFNSVFVAICGVLGCLLKKVIPARVGDTVIKGLAMCVVIFGVSGALKIDNYVIAILSIAIGAFIGELIDFDTRINRFGDRMSERFAKRGWGENGIGQAFVDTSLLTCVGAMSILGALESGMQGVHTILFTKAFIDGISLFLLASSMGIGVSFASISILFYEGAIVLFSSFLAPYLTPEVITQVGAIGSVLIIGLALNILGATKLKMGNYILVPFIPILLSFFI